MNMKKTILSVLVTLSMLFGLLPTVFADNANVTFDVTSDVTTAAPGDNITLTFSIKNAELVSGAGVKVTYDPAKLTYISSEKGNIYSFPYISGVGTTLSYDASKSAIKAFIGFTENKDITDEVIFKATFMVAGNVEPGTYTDYISVEDPQVFRGSTAFAMRQSGAPALRITEGDQSFPLAVSADKSAIAMGEDVTYTISAPSAVELNALSLVLDYDRELLAFKEGTVMAGDTASVSEDGIVWASTETKEVTGEIAAITFTALRNGTAKINAEAESAPTNVKAHFPDVTIYSDVSISVVPDKSSLTSGDTVTYTVTLNEDATVEGLQLDLDFSSLAFRDGSAELGASLAAIEGVVKDASFNGGIFTVLFANGEPAVIPAGELATITFTLAADLTGAFRPTVTESAATIAGSAFSADVEIGAVSPTPITAVLSAVPKIASVQAGDTVTYVFSIDREITPIAFQTAFRIDPAFIDGDVTVERISSAVEVAYNPENGVVSAAFAMGDVIPISGELYKVTFKTKADKNTVLTPEFTEIISDGASVAGSVVPVTILAQSSATVNISSSKEYVLPGETVDYVVDIRDAKALKILSLDMTYDPAVYSDAEVITGDASPLAATTTVDKAAGKINVTYMGENAFSGSKSGLVTVRFTAAADPKQGADGVTADVKSDAYTVLTVNNTAATKVAAAFGHLAASAAKTYLFNGEDGAEFVDVTFSLEGVTDLTNLSFIISYDTTKFICTRTIEETIAGATHYLNENGKITYVYSGAGISGDKDLITVRLLPNTGASGYTDVAAIEVVSTDAVDGVKGTKTLYIFTAAETRQIKAVQAAIDAIGEVTRDNYAEKEPAVVNARTLYDFLSPQQQAKIGGDDVIKAAEQAVATYKDAAGKAAEVDKLIGEIGTVTLNSGDAIAKAEAAYDALDDNGKYYVTKLDELRAARAEYDALAAAKAADIAAADAVDKLIEAIGTVTDASGDAIKAAREAYDALSDSAKGYVTKADALKAAEDAYAVILADKDEAAKVDALIDAIGEVTADNFLTKLDAITAAENAYAALSDARKGYVTKYDTLTAARAGYDAFYAAMKSFKVTLTSNASGYSAAIENRKASADDPTVILAVYDKTTNAVVSVNAVKASAASVSAAADTANTYAKVFVWDSLDKMAAYADVEIAG